MAAQQDGIGKRLFGDIAPQLADFNDRVLFGEVWSEPTFSQRERSLITISNLLTMYRVNALPFHFRKGLENGLSREEIIAVITHLAFYAGCGLRHRLCAGGYSRDPHCRRPLAGCP